MLAPALTIRFDHTFNDPMAFAEFSVAFADLIKKHISGAVAPKPASGSGAFTPAPAAICPPEPQPVPFTPATIDQIEVPGDATWTKPAGLQPTTVEAIGAGPKPKRVRRTKAQIAADEAARIAALNPAPAPVLPASGSFSGNNAVSAPLAAPITLEQPREPGAAPTRDDLRAAFNPLLSIPNAEPHLLEVLGRFGLPKLREAREEQFAPLIVELNALVKRLSAVA